MNTDILERFMSKEKAQTLRTAGLHKIAAALEKMAGRDIGPEMTLPLAVGLLAEKSFLKKAEDRKIQAGLWAMEKLSQNAAMNAATTSIRNAMGYKPPQPSQPSKLPGMMSNAMGSMKNFFSPGPSLGQNITKGLKGFQSATGGKPAMPKPITTPKPAGF